VIARARRGNRSPASFVGFRTPGVVAESNRRHSRRSPPLIWQQATSSDGWPRRITPGRGRTETNYSRSGSELPVGVGQLFRATRQPGGETRGYEPCPAKPQPPSGCSGQRSNLAERHAFRLTYSSLVSPVVSRTCTSHGPHRANGGGPSSCLGRAPCPAQRAGRVTQSHAVGKISAAAITELRHRR
jgi:hypothetical protein